MTSFLSPDRVKIIRSAARCSPVTTTVSGVSELGAQLDIAATSTGWKLASEIDAHTAPELATAMVQLPPGDVIVDLGDVSFMDSSGLRVLIDVAARAREAGGGCVLPPPPPRSSCVG